MLQEKVDGNGNQAISRRTVVRAIFRYSGPNIETLDHHWHKRNSLKSKIDDLLLPGAG